MITLRTDQKAIPCFQGERGQASVLSLFRDVIPMGAIPACLHRMDACVMRTCIRQFKLFQMSLLWRVGISTHAAFSSVKLDNHESVLREMIFKEIPVENALAAAGADVCQPGSGRHVGVSAIYLRC